MEQTQYRIKISVGTKLLLSLVLVLVTAIVALNFSAIVVLTKDKRETVYQQQATDAYVVGKDFVSTAHRDLDGLRLALSNLDPRHPGSWHDKKSAVQNVIDNQSNIFIIRIQTIDTIKQTRDTVFEVTRKDLLEKLELKSEDVHILPEMIQQISPVVEKSGFALVNATEVGQPPLLAIMVADLKTPVSLGVHLVATGFISLKGLAASKNTQLTLTDHSGWILFDSDPSVQYQRLNIKNDPQFEKATANTLNSGTLEFKNDEGRFLGSFYKPGLDLIVLAKTPWNFAMRAVFALIERFILIGLTAIGLAVIFAMIYTRRLVAPLNFLYDATKEVAQGNFNVSLKVKGHDEIGALSHSFNAMSRQISGLIQEKLNKAHLENEIAIASTVQQNLIPTGAVDTDHLKIRSLYRSADVCGGDWWGYFTVGDFSCVAIADATGHGLPSALITAAMRSCYSVIEKLFQEHPTQQYSASEILAYANRAIYESARGQIMMTLFLGILNLRTGEFKFANAGHNPPWLYKPEQGGFKRKSLMASGPRLGEGYDVNTYEESSIDVGVGDILMLYTDGLLEGQNVKGEQYSKKSATKAIDKVIDKGPQAMVDELEQEVATHNAGKALDDDVTLAVIQIQKIG